MPRILLLEPEATGHHVPYIRWIIESASSLGVDVLLAASVQVRRHPIIEAMARSIRFDWSEIPSLGQGRGQSALALLCREFAYRRVFKQTLCDAGRSGKVDLVLLPYLDHCFHAFALAGAPFAGTPWAAISMRHVGARWPSSRALLMKRLLRDSALRVLFSLSPRPPDTETAIYRKKVQYLPDPGDLRRPADVLNSRARLGIAGESLVILVYGVIDSRKGLLQLLEAIDRPDAPPLKVLVVGHQSDDIRFLLQGAKFVSLRARGVLEVIDRFVDDALQAQVFAAADVVWLGYHRQRGMSGVMVLAGLAERAVVVSDFGEMGRLARRHHLGPLVDIERPDSVINALRALCDPVVRQQSARRCQEAFRAHEAGIVGDRLFRALGFSSSPLPCR